RGAWETRTPMPTPRGALAAAVLNGRIHALGGSQRDALNAHEVYDPATNAWRRASAMPTRRDHLAAVAFRGPAWARGGRTSFLGTQYANVEIYDAAADGWRTGAPLPRGRGGLATAALPDRVFVFGGEAPFRIFEANEMYEPAGDRWIAMAPLPTPRHGIGPAVLRRRLYNPRGLAVPRPRRDCLHRGLHAMRAALALLLLLAAVPVAAGPREDARAALADRGNVEARRRAAGALAEAGTMADAPALLAALRDPDASVRSLAERALWEVWSRSGNEDVDHLLRAGIAEMQHGQLEASIDTFSEVIRRQPDFAEGWNKRATVYYLVGE